MTDRMTETEAVAYLTPHHLTGDGACIGLTAGKMREAMDTLHTVTASKIDRISSLEALVRELAKTLYAAEDRLLDIDGRETEEGRNILSVISAAFSHPLVSELTGEKEDGE